MESAINLAMLLSSELPLPNPIKKTKWCFVIDNDNFHTIIVPKHYQLVSFDNLPWAGRFPWLLAERFISFRLLTSIWVKSSSDSRLWKASLLAVFWDGVFESPGGFGASDFVFLVLPLLLSEVTETDIALVLSVFNVGVAGAGGLLLLVLLGPLDCFGFLEGMMK